MAILAGDALLTLAFEYICRETRGVAPERIVRVRHSLYPTTSCGILTDHSHACDSSLLESMT